MMLEVIRQERRDEIVAVVMPGLHSQGQRMTYSLTRCLQQFGLELTGKKFIRLALIHKQR